MTFESSTAVEKHPSTKWRFPWTNLDLEGSEVSKVQNSSICFWIIKIFASISTSLLKDRPEFLGNNINIGLMQSFPLG